MYGQAIIVDKSNIDHGADLEMLLVGQKRSPARLIYVDIVLESRRLPPIIQYPL